MALVKGTNCGFVTVAPEADPAEGGTLTDTAARAMKCEAPVGAERITEIGFWCDTESEEANFEAGIYEHNIGDDNPEALVSKSDTNAKGTSAGWKRVTGLNIEITPEAIYWLAIQIDDTETATRVGYVLDGGEKADVKTAQTTLTSPWGVSGDTDAMLLAVYAVYETEAVAEKESHGIIKKEIKAGDESPGIYE